jgi:O-antigen/teichoic acid export membrane protein
MVLIFSGFASLFNEMGFRAALIQKQDVNEGHFSSVFWFNIIVSILLMLLMTLSAPLIADFFKKTELAQLVRLLSLTFLIGSPVIVMRAQFAKELNFRGLSIIQLIAAAASGVLGVSLALLGYGVYALVGQLLGSAACYTILIWVYSDWRPRWLFSWSAIRELMGFSIGVIGGNSLNYWVRNADKLLIGKFLGAANLGLYSMAYTIMSLPMSQITTVLAKVMFPTLSVIQAHRGRTRMIYLRSIAVIGLLAFPAMLGLIVVADDFVIAIFGEQWQEMIPTLRLLCLGGLLQSVNSTVGWIYKSQGRSDIQFWWILFNGILTFIAVGIGINWGINGVAIAYAVRIFLTTWLNFYIPGRLINMSFGDVAKA